MRNQWEAFDDDDEVKYLRPQAILLEKLKKK